MLKTAKKIVIPTVIALTLLLSGQIVGGAEKTQNYTKQDITVITDLLKTKLKAGNEKLADTGYEAIVSPYYQVYKSVDRDSYLVVCTVTLNNETYTVYGEPSGYFTGLNTVIERQAELLEYVNNKNIVPTFDNTLIIERGGGELY